MLDALFPQTRQSILKLFLMEPEARFHLREVARQIGKPVGTIQAELASLLKAQILTKVVSGNRTYYQADRTCAIYAELRGLILKTVGLADVLRDSLAPLAGKIEAAFVYGSLASGEATSQSDVDLMVIGDVSFADVVKAIQSAQDSLAREVNPTVYPTCEFRNKVKENHHFVTSVLAGPKIFLIGGESELAGLAEEPLADAT